MPPEDSKTPRLVFALAALGLLFSILTLRRFFVGFWSDDARDILAAQSLLQGRYVFLQLPGHPPANFPLPGFPLLLSPWVALAAPHWEWLKLAALTMSGAALVLAYRLWSPFLSSGARVLFVLLIALNPNTMALSTQVLADGSYLFLLLASLSLLSRATKQNTTERALFVLAAAWAAWTRPEGYFLLIALGLATWGDAKQRLAVLLAMLAALIPLARNVVSTGSAIGYDALVRDSWPVLVNHPLVLARNLGQLVHSLTVEIFLGVDYTPATLGGKRLTIGSGGAILGILGAGIYAWYRHTRPLSPLHKAVGFYLGMHLAIHTLWLAQHPHYLWPLLPFIAFFFALGLDQSPKPIKYPLTLVISVLITLLYGSQALYAIQRARHPSAGDSGASTTYQWIREHTAPDAYLLTPQSAAMTLYTGRFARAIVQVSQEDEFYATLLENHMTHVTLQPTAFLHVQTLREQDPGWLWRQFDQWTKASPSRYARVYENSLEDTTVYAVVTDPKFLQAYVLYRSERDRITRVQPTAEEWRRHLTSMESAIGLSPFPSLLNAYGVAALLSGERLPAATHYLERAARTRPSYYPARLNLARIYTKMGKTALARTTYEAAARDASKDPEAVRWIAQIEREIKQID